MQHNFLLDGPSRANYGVCISPSTASPVIQFSFFMWKALDCTMPAAYTKASKSQLAGGHRSCRCSRTGRTRVPNSCAVFARPVPAIEVPAQVLPSQFAGYRMSCLVRKKDCNSRVCPVMPLVSWLAPKHLPSSSAASSSVQPSVQSWAAGRRLRKGSYLDSAP